MVAAATEEDVADAATAADEVFDDTDTDTATDESAVLEGLPLDESDVVESLELLVAPTDESESSSEDEASWEDKSDADANPSTPVLDAPDASSAEVAPASLVVALASCSFSYCQTPIPAAMSSKTRISTTAMILVLAFACTK